MGVLTLILCILQTGCGPMNPLNAYIKVLGFGWAIDYLSLIEELVHMDVFTLMVCILQTGYGPMNPPNA